MCWNTYQPLALGWKLLLTFPQTTLTPHTCHKSPLSALTFSLGHPAPMSQAPTPNDLSWMSEGSVCTDFPSPHPPPYSGQRCQCLHVCPGHHTQTYWTLTLSGFTDSNDMHPSPSSGWEVTGGKGLRESCTVESRNLSSRE
jgi:hypothetical protein